MKIKGKPFQPVTSQVYLIFYYILLRFGSTTAYRSAFNKDNIIRVQMWYTYSHCATGCVSPALIALQFTLIKLQNP